MRHFLVKTGLARPRLPIFISLWAWVLSLGLVASNLWGQKLNPPILPVEPLSEAAVLGSRTGYNEPRIYVSDDKWYQNGGVISLAATAEPSVQISSWQVTGEVTIKVYRAQPQTLLAYLLYDKENKQLNPVVDATGLPLITTLTHQIAGENEDKKITLPLEGSGIWLLKITNEKVQTDAFVVRSNVGVLTKEGNNDFIFWAQDYSTRRSAGGGTVVLYRLQDKAQTLATAAFNDSGIATSAITADADIGWYQRGEDVALVPINLKYPILI